MADWIKVIKPQVEAEISKAGITDKQVVSLIMNFERRLNTCRNYLANGGTWSNMCYNLKAKSDAYFILEKLQIHHGVEWFKYLDANNYCRNAHVGDFLA